MNVVFLFFSGGRSICTVCVLCYKWEIQAKWRLMWNILGDKASSIVCLTQTCPCALLDSNTADLCGIEREIPPRQESRLRLTTVVGPFLKVSQQHLKVSSLCVYKLYSNQILRLSIDLQMHSCYQSWLTVCTTPMYNYANTLKDKILKIWKINLKCKCKLLIGCLWFIFPLLFTCLGVLKYNGLLARWKVNKILCGQCLKSLIHSFLCR